MTFSYDVSLEAKAAIALFIVSLAAFVAESQLAQYVQSDLGFRHPFLIFYIVHSSFAIMFPLHILYLAVTSKYSIEGLWLGLLLALKRRLSDIPTEPSMVQNSDFPRGRFIRLLTLLTIGMTVPSLLWFSAVSLAPITDVTALWNTNAFFAYVIMVKCLQLEWDARRLGAVTLATLGAAAVIYGGSSFAPQEPPPESPLTPSTSPSAPLVGDLVTLCASIGYGFYQVLYKVYVALPSDPDVQGDQYYTPVPNPDDLEDDSSASPLLIESDAVYPPPFALYPNLLTSAIGLCTLFVLWIPLIVLHVLGIVSLALPSDWATVVAIAGIAVSGVVFNAGFMVLLGVWGPIVTSVGSLLTIVLVFVSDAIFGGALDTVTVWSTLGSGSIVLAFAMLAYDMTRRG